MGERRHEGKQPTLDPPFSTVQKDKELNTPNICLWYLEAIKDATNKVFHGTDGSSIKKVQDPAFIAKLAFNIKRIDALKESIGGGCSLSTS